MRLLANSEFEITKKEASTGSREKSQNTSLKYNRTVGGELNPRPREYEAEVLTT